MPDSPVSFGTPAARLAHALSVYAEPLVAGRRVLVVGDAALGLGERLSELGARVVHIYDPDGARVAAAAQTRGVSVRALTDDFDVRDGAYDLVFVPDLGILPDPAQLMVRARRVLGTQGAALIAARNGEGSEAASARGARPFDYYELYDLVSLQFEHARMIAELPFSGVAIAELGIEGDVQVSVDAQLAGPPAPPPFFIVLAGQRDVRLEPYAIVQLPAPAEDATAVAAAVTVQAVDTGELQHALTALAESQLQTELLRAQLDEQRAAVKQLTAAAVPAGRLAELEAGVAEQAARHRDAEGRAGDNHVRAERLTQEIRNLEDELQKQRDRGFRLTREVDDEKKARTKAELELGMLRKSPELPAARERVSYLEEALRSSEDVATALQGRLVEVEAMAIAQSEQLALLVAEVDALRIAAELGQQAAVQVDELVLRAEAAERRAVRLAAEASHDDVHTAELGQLEAALRDRARAIHALEQELRRRERMVQELLSALEEQGQPVAAAVPAVVDAHGPSADAEARAALARECEALRRRVDALGGDNEDLRGKLDALAAFAARRESAVQATAWRIEELEQAVAAAANGRPDDQARHGVATPDLEAAREQIDILKQALAQEHEARRRYESGEELRQARAELERQASVIEELRIARG